MVVDGAVPHDLVLLREHQRDPADALGERVVTELIALRVHVVDAVAEAPPAGAEDRVVVCEGEVDSIARAGDHVVAHLVLAGVPQMNAVAALYAGKRRVSGDAIADDAVARALADVDSEGPCLDLAVADDAVRAVLEEDYCVVPAEVPSRPSVRTTSPSIRVSWRLEVMAQAQSTPIKWSALPPVLLISMKAAPLSRDGRIHASVTCSLGGDFVHPTSSRPSIRSMRSALELTHPPRSFSIEQDLGLWGAAISDAYQALTVDEIGQPRVIDNPLALLAYDPIGAPYGLPRSCPRRCRRSWSTATPTTPQARNAATNAAPIHLLTASGAAAPATASAIMNPRIHGTISSSSKCLSQMEGPSRPRWARDAPQVVGDARSPCRWAPAGSMLPAADRPARFRRALRVARDRPRGGSARASWRGPRGSQGTR